MRRRPGHLLRTVRCYFLFYWTRASRGIFGLAGARLGPNVRLQKRGSLMAESPHASISIGADSIIYEDARIEAYRSGEVDIGSGAIIGAARIISRYRIRIGERFLSSWNVFIQDYDPHPTAPDLRKVQVDNMINSFRPWFDGPQRGQTPTGDWDFPGEEILIGNDVWVGAGATILKGAKIGSGSIIATGSVVLKGEYPERSLLAGNPAKVIKQLQLASEPLQRGDSQ